MKANDRQMDKNSNQFDKYMSQVELPRVSWNTYILQYWSRYFIIW